MNHKKTTNDKLYIQPCITVVSFRLEQGYYSITSVNPNRDYEYDAEGDATKAYSRIGDRESFF